MRIAVRSTLILDVPDDALGPVRDRLYDAEAARVDEPMQTGTGQHYIVRAIDAFEVIPVTVPGEE